MTPTLCDEMVQRFRRFDKRLRRVEMLLYILIGVSAPALLNAAGPLLATILP